MSDIDAAADRAQQLGASLLQRNERWHTLDTAERAALAIGATRLDGAGPDWRVYADPAGHPFCLVWAA
ncbi:VOC family protein [Micromonospora sp. LOL_015]|uniref:VOC family protein n=1 Tax=Micromonospora sp. LOL_015 TaxID=3345416 RepID=UPI003A881AC7